MDEIMIVAAVVFCIIATLTHVAIFVMESVLWSRPAVWRRFGLRSQGEADVVRPMAYNQGFYNLFLALGAGTGLGLMFWNEATGGDFWQGALFVTCFSLACMVLASIVLLTTSHRFWQATIVQGGAALLSLILFIVLLTPSSEIPVG